VTELGERDPSTDPEMDLRRFPQDPDARQPGERLEAFWDRVGEHRPTPRQEGDPVDEPTG
jgi:hypothetical protein